jgi:hypothetical protein
LLALGGCATAGGDYMKNYDDRKANAWTHMYKGAGDASLPVSTSNTPGSRRYAGEHP